MVFSGVAQVAGQSSAFGGEMVGSAIAHKRARQLMNEQQNWQERMSNTAYQRGVADLDKAGLNRILALGKGGMGPASTPSGGIVASGSKPELGRAVSTALDVNKWKTEKQLVNQNTATAKEAAGYNREAAGNQREQSALATASAEKRRQETSLVERQTRAADYHIESAKAESATAGHLESIMAARAWQAEKNFVTDMRQDRQRWKQVSRVMQEFNPFREAQKIPFQVNK